MEKPRTFLIHRLQKAAGWSVADLLKATALSPRLMTTLRGGGGVGFASLETLASAFSNKVPKRDLAELGFATGDVTAFDLRYHESALEPVDKLIAILGDAALHSKVKDVFGAETKGTSAVEYVYSLFNASPDDWDRLINGVKRVFGKKASKEAEDLLLALSETRIQFSRVVRGSFSAAVQSTSSDAQPDRNPIMQSAYKYVKSAPEAQACLRELLNIAKTEELTSEQLVDLLLLDVDPLHRLWAAVMSQLNRENSAFRAGLTDVQRETISRFCDYATSLVLPEDQLKIFRHQISQDLILAGTTDRPLIVLHFAREWAVAAYETQSTDTDRRIIEQIDSQIIPANLQKIIESAQASPEAGVSRAKNSQYQKDFVRGLAFELGIPGSLSESDSAIETLTYAIRVKLDDWKDLRDFPIRIAVFLDESRSEDVKKLKRDFPQIFFVQLPRLNHPAYTRIDSRRVDINQKINSASRTNQ